MSDHRNEEVPEDLKHENVGLKTSGVDAAVPTQDEPMNISHEGPQAATEPPSQPVPELVPQEPPSDPPSSGTATVMGDITEKQGSVLHKEDETESPSKTEDYFGAERAPQEADSTPPPSLSVSLPVTPGQSGETSHDPSPPENASTWETPFQVLTGVIKQFSPQASRPPTSDPATTRPVSVPNFPSRPEGQQIDPQGTATHLLERTLPTVEDHSNAGASNRMANPPSSHSPFGSQSSIPEIFARESILGHTRAKTAGNTPAQSPGVESPSVRSPPGSTLKLAAGSEDGRPGSAIQYSSHHEQDVVE